MSDTSAGADPGSVRASPERVPPSRRAGSGPAVAARYGDLARARAAIGALERAGVDGNDIELLGRPADAARVPHDPKLADRRVVFYLLPRLARGLALGLAVGVAVGLLIAGVAFATGLLSWSVGRFGVCVLVGLFPGATLGVLLSFERSVSLADDWALTFEDAPAGPVWVGVYTGDGEARARARRVLQHDEPLELR